MPEEIFDLIEDLFDGARKRKKKRDRQKEREVRQNPPPRKQRQSQSAEPIDLDPRLSADPQTQLEVNYRQQKKMLQDLRRSTDEVSQARQRLTERALSHERQLDEFDARAKEHLQQGREDLARVVLERKRLAVAQLSEFEREIEELKREETHLMSMEARLEAELESFWLRSQVLRSKHSSAQARSRLGDAASGLSGEMGSAGSALDNAEKHVAELDSRSRMLDGMLESGMSNADPRIRFERDLELSEVDADLEALRRQMREDRDRRSNP